MGQILTSSEFRILLDSVSHDLADGVRETQLHDACEQTYGPAITARLWHELEHLRCSGIPR